MVFKPATPGFLTTLTATILLVVVSFNVPYFKSVYFLQASYNNAGVTGLINIGTLGYCISVNGDQTCTHPSIGYEFDPNTLLGNTTRFQIPVVVTKWITYALFLHVIAMGLAAVSALFGLLAHIREFSMACFSSCISGAAAFISLIAFVFDLVLFFLARTRIREIDGATATIGNAIWLTLAAWILLFISGCMFGIGRCCIGSRPRGPAAPKQSAQYSGGGGGYGANPVPTPAINNSYAEQMRMEAIKAEVERKARQNASTQEGGLPAFDEYETRPLTSDAEPMSVHSPYRDQPTPSNNRYGAAGAATGYVASHAVPTTPSRQPSSSSVGSAYSPGHSPGIASGGRRPSDYNPAFPAAPAVAYPPQPANGYPPRGARQASLQESNIYENAGLTAAGGAAAATAAAQAGGRSNSRNDYLSPNNNPHPRGDSYGHHTQASSYYSTYSQQPYTSQYGGEASQDPSVATGAYNYNNQGYDQSAAYGAGQYHQQPPSSTYQDPYQQQQSSYSQYPPRQPSTDVYSKPLPQPSESGGYPPQSGYHSQGPSTGYPSSQSPPGGFPSHQSPPLPNDLNFPGVVAPSPRVYASPTAIETNLPYGATSSTVGYVSPTRGQRLPGLREDSEPSSSLGPASGRAAAGPEDAPPEYEPSNSSLGYRNEKATYRPTNT